MRNEAKAARLRSASTARTPLPQAHMQWAAGALPRRGSRLLLGAYMRSKIPAAPMPVPTHMVTMPYLRLRRRRA